MISFTCPRAKYVEEHVEVGPIWNHSHAELVATEYIQNHPECIWTGHWNTPRPNEMSTIQVKRRLKDVYEENVESIFGN